MGPGIPLEPSLPEGPTGPGGPYERTPKRGVRSLQDPGAGEVLAPAVIERGGRPGGGSRTEVPPFPLMSPNATCRTYPGTGGTRGTSSTLVSRRTLREDVRVDGYSSTSSTEGRSAPAEPLHGLRAPSVAAATLKEPHPAPW